MTSAVVRQTFVYVGASGPADAAAFVAGIAGALSRPGSVGAGGVYVASAIVDETLVDVDAAFFALPLPVEPYRTAAVAAALGIGTNPLGMTSPIRHLAFVDVQTPFRAISAPGVTRFAIANNKTRHFLTIR